MKKKSNSPTEQAMIKMLKAKGINSKYIKKEASHILITDRTILQSGITYMLELISKYEDWYLMVLCDEFIIYKQKNS